MSNLAQYVREIFDLNKDGKVTFKEFFAVLLPNQAVGIALLVVDILMLVAEYRVWDVGLTITNQNPYLALGFVAVSGVPFYLSQVLWLYPRASLWQQAIAILMGGSALYMSAQFGLADLSRNYNVDGIVQLVIQLTVVYVISLLVYVVIDGNIQLFRKKVQARAKADFQDDINGTVDDVLNSVEKSLAREKELRDKYGDEAVEAHLEMMRGKPKKQHKNSNAPEAPARPVNPPIPPLQQ